MSSILIKDIEMPKERESFTVTIKYNGLVFDTETMIQVAEAYEVPPHGRLIDADKLADSFEPSDFWNSDAEDNCFAAVRIVHSAPTIIPASEEVYSQYTDTAGNFHWTGTHSGAHTIKAEEGE